MPLSSSDCGTHDVIVLESKQKNSQLLDNGDCTYIHISCDGTATQINANPDISVVDNCDGTVTFAWKDHDPVVIDYCKVIGDNCNASLVFNVDGTYTFTDNAGTVSTLPFPTSRLTDNGNGTVTHVAGDGTITNLNICNIVGDNCSDQLIANPSGSFTHVAVDGTVTNIPAPAVSQIIDNGNGTYTHDDGAGTASVIAVGGSVVQATAPFVTTNGTALLVNDYYVLMPNGQTWA